MNKNYELPWEIFEAVLTNSTWGSSQVGGPVWVWDFSIEALEKLCPNHPEIEKLKQIWQEADGWKCRGISGKIQQEAYKIISMLGLCNILVITDGNMFLEKDGKRIAFYSLFSFLRRIHLLLHGSPKPSLPGAPLRDISFILRDQSQKIKHNDYIWKISLDENKILSDKTPRFPNVLRLGSNWKQYLPNLVYDCMELTFMEYWRYMEKDYSYTQYPLMFYNDKLVAGTTMKVEIPYYDKPQQLKLILPALANQEIWHRGFYPKERWHTRKA